MKHGKEQPEPSRSMSHSIANIECESMCCDDTDSEGDSSLDTAVCSPAPSSPVGAIERQPVESATTYAAQLALCDIVIGEKLGEGGFCIVHECKVPSATPMGTISKPLAVKMLKGSSKSDVVRWKQGAADMVTESRYVTVHKSERQYRCCVCVCPNAELTF